MRVERAGAGRPALGEDLHREKLGIDFGLERSGRSHRAAIGAVVGLNRFVGAIGHIPDVRFFHASTTPTPAESFVARRKALVLVPTWENWSRQAERLPIGSARHAGVWCAAQGEFTMQM